MDFPNHDQATINIALITPTVTANRTGEKASMDALIPAPKESRDNAVPKRTASKPLIVPDLSRSAVIGLFKI